MDGPSAKRKPFPGTIGNMKSTMLHFAVTPDLRKQVEKHADSREWSVSFLCRQAVKEFLERNAGLKK